MQKVGLVLNDLGPNQIAYTAIMAFSQPANEISPYLFFNENARHCMDINIPCFNIRDAQIFCGHLISTSLSNLKIIHSFIRNQRYYYVWDLEELRHGFDKEFFYKVIFDNTIVKLFRSSDHYQYITNKYIKLPKLIVNDFDSLDILKAINAVKNFTTR